MHLKIRHAIDLTFAEPFEQLNQVLRVQPLVTASQAVRRWSVRDDTGRALEYQWDGFGNIIHSHTVTKRSDQISISIEGEVETADTYGVLTGIQEPIAPLFFLQRDPALGEIAPLDHIIAPARGRSENALEQLHWLMQTVNGRRKAVDEVRENTTPLGSFEAICKSAAPTAADLSHLMIGCAQALGYPARFVSGYHWLADDDVSPATHCWTEIYVADLGWVGFDPSHVVCPTEAYVRVACGRNHLDAQPVRTITWGGASQQENVSVQIEAGLTAQQQQQQ